MNVFLDHGRLVCELYRWPDGSTASVVVAANYPLVELSFYFKGMTVFTRGIDSFWLEFEVQEDDVRKVLVYSDTSKPNIPSDCRRKVAGLFLDLGVEPLSCPHVYPSEVLLLPRWVDDEIWSRRYDLARDRSSPPSESPPREPFLGYLRNFFVGEGLFIKKGSSYVRRSKLAHAAGPHFTALWEDSQPPLLWERDVVGTSLEEVVDEACRMSVLLPRREWASWEEENVERGTFTFLPAEEVELYGVVGERLPLWWGWRRFKDWLEERMS